MSQKQLGSLQTGSEYCAYPHVQSIAYQLLRCAQQSPYASTYTSLASIVFSAFTFEAALNQIGVSKDLQGWDEDGCRKLDEKIKAVSLHCKHRIYKGKGNGQLIHQAFRIRDSYAHSKPMTHEHPLKRTIPKAKIENVMNSLPTIMPWQDSATPEFAEKVFNAVTGEASTLFRNAGIDEDRLTISIEGVSFC